MKTNSRFKTVAEDPATEAKDPSYVTPAAKEEPKSGSNKGTTEHEKPDEELAAFEQAELERYRVKNRAFPAPMGEAAFQGNAGEIVRTIEPVSEASREAILAQFLVAFGNLIGRGPHRKQAGIHRLNEFAVLVGETAIARKGTSWNATQTLLSALNEEWLATRMRDGFQSGEAIVHSVRDTLFGTIPVNKRKAGKADKAENTILDLGVDDKRLLIVEEEFARLLIVASRPGNTLSSTLRKAWDGKKWLYTEGKLAPEKATNAHVSMIGHITLRELLDCMREVENKNGFSNRVLWVAARRERKLALPGWVNWRHYPDVIDRLLRVVETFGSPAPEREIDWSQEARKQWCKFYESINTGNAGVVGSIIARSDAHVLRLTMLFTVLENSTLMEPRHLNAAIAFWQYCERSAMWAFGEKTGNKAADQIYWALQREPEGMTRAQINSEVFSNHASKSQMDFAFSTLVDARLVHFLFERDKGGRPTERWFAKTAEDNLAI